ncbi:hypothetical protein [Schaalia hyovaginalis]|uniref:Uncharacterized protein n=1 Tax=Schaalia hyovaginalis TaxID=29316 RepID=A0A923E3S8_9ACTO|nr:hypothetical protein [Schaalia hyovaginalis]MBB6333655.1 hypothetical protein [Schaalia hyovaginalis]MDY2669785.1 hypothetical protein [Schaalia hyovaginalis]
MSAIRVKDIIWGADGNALCPCQYGQCGHCEEGRHDMCPYERPDTPPAWKEKLKDMPLGWVGRSRGTAFGQAPFFDARVSHDGRCACFREGHRGAELAPVQLELWDVFGDEWKLVEM